MFEVGLIDEVRWLLERHTTLGRTAAQALGYREAIEHLRGGCSISQAKSRVKVRTHQFARRQETWFRSLSECRRIEQHERSDPADVAAQLVEMGRDVR